MILLMNKKLIDLNFADRRAYEQALGLGAVHRILDALHTFADHVEN